MKTDALANALKFLQPHSGQDGLVHLRSTDDSLTLWVTGRQLQCAIATVDYEETEMVYIFHVAANLERLLRLVEAQGDDCELRYDAAKGLQIGGSTIACCQAEEAPEKLDLQLRQVDPKAFREAAAFTSKIKGNQLITGVCIDGDCIVGTNGNYCYRAKGIDLGFRVTLFAETALAIGRMTEPWIALHDKRTMIARDGNTEYRMPVMAGDFPDWSRVTNAAEAECNASAHFDRDALMDTLRVAAAFSDRCHFDTDAEGQRMTARAQDGSVFERVVPYEGLPLRNRWFNPTLLLKLLACCKEDSVSISHRDDGGRACVIKEADMLMVLMGMVNQPQVAQAERRAA